MSKKEGGSSFYLYIVALVAIVALFYMVVKQSNVAAIPNSEISNTDSITGNAIAKLPGTGDFGRHSYVMQWNSETKTGILYVTVTGLKQPLTDVTHTYYAFGTITKKTSEESSKELGTLSCGILTEGGYGKVAKKNDQTWGQNRYECKAAFEIPRYTSGDRHHIQLVDSEGNRDNGEEVDNNEMYNVHTFNYGGVSKQTGTYTQNTELR